MYEIVCRIMHRNFCSKLLENSCCFPGIFVVGLPHVFLRFSPAPVTDSLAYTADSLV